MLLKQGALFSQEGVHGACVLNAPFQAYVYVHNKGYGF